MLLQLPDPATRAQRSQEPTPGPADRPEVERQLAVQFVGCFEGFSLITVACDHRPYWMLIEVASVLGIEEPARMLASLELGLAPIEGTLVVLEGGDRRELLDKLDRAHVVLAPSDHRKALTLVGPAAVDELCARFDSAVARRLRNHLRDQAVPTFHAWERAARALEQPILSLDAATVAANRLEFERRCLSAAVLERLLDRLEHDQLVSDDLIAAHRVVSSELALGGWLDDYDEFLTHGWLTPTQLASRWEGMSPVRVGKLIAHLGLKGSRAHSRAYLNKALGHDRTVICHAYSPAAVGLIERELRSLGYRRLADLDDLEPKEM